MKILHEAAEHLIRVGGADIILRPHGLYELSVRKLDEDTLQQGAQDILEESDDGSR